MHTPSRRLFAALAYAPLCLLFFATPAAVRAQPTTPEVRILYIKDEDGHIARVRSSIPNNGEDPFPDFDKAITGLQANEQILAIDVRPKTGELYGVSNQSRVYVIDYRTGTSQPAVATLVGPGPFSPALNYTAKIDIDFNPTVDRIRLVTDNDQNLRLHPDTGAVAFTDGALAYAAGDANAGQNPNVVGAAYTNSFNGATATTLFVADSALDIIATQNPPNAGTLNTQRTLPAPTDQLVGFDIADDRAAGGGTAYLTLRSAPGAIPRLYALNLSTGESFDRGPFFENSSPRSIAVQTAPRGVVLISEFRFNGPNGANDEFVELYNNTDRDIVVRSVDSFRDPVTTTEGWVLYMRNPQSVFNTVLIPNGTVIPARGHYLIANDTPPDLTGAGGYSLGASATPDQTYRYDIPTNGGLALFQSASDNLVASRLDAAGYAGESNPMYREGAGFPSGGPEFTVGIATSIEYSLYRDLSGGTPKDTDDNTADFVAVNTAAANTGAGLRHRLGAPGPESRQSPVQRNAAFKSSLIDGCVSSSAQPNRVRDTSSDPSNNSTFGTLSIRRRFTNNTGASVTRLRFRIVDITTAPPPDAATADLRARTSSPVAAPVSAACGGITVNVQGTTLEQPPAQTEGGGYNSTLAAGTISTGTPLAAGASVNVQFLLGVEQAGNFRFIVNVEALPDLPVPVSGRSANALKTGTRDAKSRRQ